MIGRSGERGSGISVLTARHEDDDIYIYIYIYIYTHTHTHTHTYIYVCVCEDGLKSSYDIISIVYFFNESNYYKKKKSL